MADRDIKYNSLIQRLKKTYSKQNLFDLLLFLSAALSVSAISFLLVSLIEHFANGSIPFRTNLFYTFVAITLVSLISSFVLYKRKVKGSETEKIIRTSNKVGYFFPAIKDKLTNVIQMYKQVVTSQGVSIDLVNYELDLVHSSTENLNFDEIIEKKNFKKFLVLFLTAFLLLVTLCGINNFALNPAATRVINFNKSYVPAPPFEISLQNREINVLRGDNIFLTIKSKGNSPEKLSLFIKEDGQEDFDEFKISKNDDGKYIYKINSIKKSVQYYASTEWYNSAIQTKIGKVNVGERPVIKQMNGKIVYPSYTGEPQTRFGINNADIVAIKGSRVNISLTANKPIKKSFIVFSAEKSVLDSNGAVKETTYTNDTLRLTVKDKDANISFAIKKSGYYYFKLFDFNNVDNENPIKYSVIATEDNYPKINLLYPKENIKLSENAIIQIDADIFDDFGFSALKLNYRLIKSKYAQPEKDFHSLNISIKKTEKEQLASFVWDLNELSITPEDEYEFYLEVFDNDIVNGPKSSKTQILTVRMPSLDEVIASSEKAQAEVEKDMSNILKDAQGLKKDIEDFKQDLRKDFKKKEMSYEQKKKAENIADKQQQITENVKELQEKINETAKQMNENKVLSPETLEKFMKLQELLKQMDIPQLRAMQEKLNKELKNMSPEEMQKALENMKFNEEQFRKSIERSMKILERMKAEQKTDAIKKMGEKLEKDLEKLKEQTKNSDPNDKKGNEQLAKQQDKLNQDLQKLDEQMKELENMLSKLEDMPMNSLKEANQALNKQETSQQMQQAEQNLKDGQKNQAQQNQQNAQENLKKFNKKMTDMKKEMQNKVSRETLNKMKKAVQDMIQISKEQEQLKNQTKASNYNSTQLPEINKKQGELSESLQRVAKSLTEVSEKSFAVTPEMGKDIGQALQQMQNAMNELSERSTNSASQGQQQSMTKMNSVIDKMQDMIGQMQGQGNGKGQGQGKGSEGSGGSSSGMSNSPGGSGFSMQLQQAAAQQQMINNSMRQMMQQQGRPGQDGQNGKSEMQRQAEYGRLQNEQGNARKSIEELATEQKEYIQNGGKKPSVDLKKIADEMKEVMSDIESGNITQETLDRQEKILSKLLDATRSVNERDYEKQRESKSGTQFSQNSPEALKLKEYLNKLSEDKLRESLKLGYTKDMEALIKKYFDELKQKSN